MRIAFLILIGLHGIIHLLGFFKAFQISDIEALSQPISRSFGILWLIGFVLFGLTLFLLIRNNVYWWSVGIVAIIVSQSLIFLFWQDAKFGSLPNIIILLVCIVGWSYFSFTQKIKEERETILSKCNVDKELFNQQRFDALPSPVQKWLTHSGVNKQPPIANVYLKQEVKMKLKPEQKEWIQASAEQYFTINPPAFNWSVDLHMNPFFSIQGRDKFEDGKGEMLMKILSIITVVDVQDNNKINEAALQRYLAEIVWFPSAALSTFIKWEYIDEQSARATLKYKETIGSGVFYFDKNGSFTKFSTMRYKDTDDDAQKYEWIAEVLENKVINGIIVPTKLNVTWKLEDINWNWLELEITELKYNLKGL